MGGAGSGGHGTGPDDPEAAARTITKTTGASPSTCSPWCPMRRQQHGRTGTSWPAPSGSPSPRWASGRSSTSGPGCPPCVIPARSRGTGSGDPRRLRRQRSGRGLPCASPAVRRSRSLRDPGRPARPARHLPSPGSAGPDRSPPAGRDPADCGAAFLPDEDQPYRLVRRAQGGHGAGQPPGDFSRDDQRPQPSRGQTDPRAVRQATSPAVPRAFAEIARFFDGLELVSPGLVDAACWGPTLPGRSFLAVWKGSGRGKVQAYWWPARTPALPAHPGRNPWCSHHYFSQYR